MRTVVTTIVLLGLRLPLGAQETPRLPITYTSIAEIQAALDEQGEAGGGCFAERGGDCRIASSEVGGEALG